MRLFLFWFCCATILCSCRTGKTLPEIVSPKPDQPQAVEVAPPKPVKKAELELPEHLTSGVVLQRGEPMTIWGWDQPGQRVVGRIAGQTAEQVAGEDGAFSLEFPPMPAGGPFWLEIEGSSARVVRDVMIGDVWFCVGQSNMQWSLMDTTEAGTGLAEPDDLKLRIFSVERRPSWEEERTVRGFWQPSTQAERERFSAVAFQFGSALRELDPSVPIGIYEASLSGSAIEPWMPKQAFDADPRLQLLAKRVESFGPDSVDSDEEKRIKFLSWLNQSLTPLEPKKAEELPWHSAPVNEQWKPVQVPGRWEKQLEVNFDGAVWFRRSVEVPKDWLGEPLELGLGQIDDFDQAWFNGKPVGRTFVETQSPWAKARRYQVPAEAVHEGRNEIAIRVIDFFSGGGLAGPESQLTLAPIAMPTAEPIPLSGEWLYRVESIIPASAPPPPPLPGFNRNATETPTVLFNGMIAPLRKIRSCGVVWYQGESNAFVPNLYGEKWSSLQRTWRKEFENGDWPFLLVQLPGFGENLNPQDIPWAEFREIQQQLAEENSMTVLIPTLDLGDCKEIHPRRKKAVGERLAAAAERLKKQPASAAEFSLIGPHYQSFSKNEDGSVMIETAGCTGNLRMQSPKPYETEKLKTSFWASDGNGVFTPAEATLIGNKILVTSKTLSTIEHVRYAWANCPTATVVDEAGLPLFPFRTDAYKESIMVFESEENE